MMKGEDMFSKRVSVLQMIGKNSLPGAAVGTVALLLVAVTGSVQAQDDLTLQGQLGTASHHRKGDLTPQEELGKLLFFDAKLSTPAGQACAVCHGPNVGWTGPDEAINRRGAVYEGAMPGRFGNRKPPASAYAGDSPILYWDGTKWMGGMFWDGRATGGTLGDPLAEQAQGPFLNPLEQNNASPQVVIDKVLASDYKKLFQKVCASYADKYECIGLGSSI